ncbi:MAG: hypothetical protein ACXABZ_08010 [Candidatus Thorarchaeota archaeon]|jgi:hypothetical protein
MAKMYVEYLNGPLGKGVLGRLKEGESFSLRSQKETLKVTKKRGRAEVVIIPVDVDTKKSLR